MQTFAATVLACLTVASSFLGAASSATAEIYHPRFAAAAQEHLKVLAVSESDIQSVRIIAYRRTSERNNPESFGMEAWVQLNSCEGNLVIFMNSAALVRDTYTRGDCQIAGVRRY